jgi:hypothetical protein
LVYRIWLIAAVLLALTTPELRAQQRVGVSSAVNPDATGVPPGGAVRRLVIGQEVVFNERISTGAGGQTQLLFLDESAMSIGPNSDLTIDQFVYDPNTGVGKLAMSTTRGVMRFVGGKLSKQTDAVTCRTPSAVVAVRGGVFLLELGANGQLSVYFLFGNELVVTGLNGVTQTLSRAGFAITVAGPGASPSEPYRAPAPKLAELQSQLDGRAGGAGGVLRIPTDTIIADSGIGRTVSGNLAASAAAAAATHPTPIQPTAINPANLQAAFSVNTVQAQGNASVATTFQHPTVTTFLGSNLFITKDGGVQPIGVDQTSIQNGTLTVITRAGSATIPLPQGNANFGPQGTTSSFGPLTGSTFLSADNQAFYVSATSANFPGYAGFVTGGVPSVTVPTTGAGTYSGNVTGSVFTNGVNSLASGTFTNSYNFANNTGQFNVNNFGGRNFGGNVTGAGNSYSGALAGTNLAGTVNGQFFGNLAANTVGRFQVGATAGTPYSAFGVFGGTAH